MIIKNKLDKSFGPEGTAAGLVLFFIGIITTFSSAIGIILILAGAFIGFSSTSATIDTEKRRIKFSNNIFGFIPFGKWISTNTDMRIGIKESNIIWTVYSLSNRSADIGNRDFRLLLFNAEDNEIMPVKKVSSLESAIAERKILCSDLGINEVN